MSILQQGFDALAKALCEFGYPDVTADMVEAAHTKWNNGEKLTNVIEFFCEKEFDERPEIFGKPEQKGSAE